MRTTLNQSDALRSGNGPEGYLPEEGIVNDLIVTLANKLAPIAWQSYERDVIRANIRRRSGLRRSAEPISSP